MTQTTHISLRGWVALLGLTFSTFIFNTSEFIPVALLSDIGTEFHRSEAATGMLISVYAWAVMLLSLPLMLATTRFNMRRLLMVLIALFAIFQGLSAVAADFRLLMAARIGVACTHAIFWSIISPIAIHLVPERHRSLALSMVVAGSSIAMVLGLPLGRIIGLWLGWRWTFGCIGAFAAITFFYLLFTLPSVPSPGHFSLKSLPDLWRNRALVSIYAIALLIPTSYFICYSYIEPFLLQTAGMSPQSVTVALMFYGLAGFLGSVAFSWWFNRNRHRFCTISMWGIAIAMAALLPCASLSQIAIFLACLIFGMSTTAFNVAFQAEIINHSPAVAAAVSMSIFSGIYNLGIGSGTALGGIVCNHLSIAYIGLAGAAIAVVTLILWRLRILRTA